jgi:transposase
MAQVEIITGKERRRGWTREQKEAILAEAFAPGVNIRAFSRQADISTGLLYKWRRTVWKMKREPAFARLVALAATAPALSASAATSPAGTVPLPVPAAELPAIEIDMQGNKVRIPPTMPSALASAMIRALVRV